MLKSPMGGGGIRRRILELLVDLDGATAPAVAVVLGITPDLARAHLGVLAAAGLLRAERVAGRTCYHRDEARIAEARDLFESGW
ncbi:helix-turn-helix transcriptional regulator [Streptomyces sp. B3I8]|uniref:ArsR/SmtB family transcription factor n=1 Tax=Streptomyces sp. B3I8 TaxID=3042303 RepID=UPI0027860090|nr:ArsR family transcriptional regulator [Streptomyces sp. B3I8]MDQ0785534.1 putative ArsR family transcriptional regulator [Streptomyces sp. B3I8]